MVARKLFMFFVVVMFPLGLLSLILAAGMDGKLIKEGGAGPSDPSPGPKY